MEGDNEKHKEQYRNTDMGWIPIPVGFKPGTLWTKLGGLITRPPKCIHGTVKVAAEWPNSVVPDPTAPKEQLDLGLHCLLQYVSPNV